MDVWRINLAEKSLQVEAVPSGWEKLGGRGLTARILLDEVRATCYPLGSENKLIFAPGLLSGHRLSSCDRLSVGSKSPLTGGIKEANAGGTTAIDLSRLGIKVLILENKISNGLWVLHLSMEGARFDSVDDLIGVGAYESTRLLLDRYGSRVSIALIGPSGELKLNSAGILNLDKDRVPSRIAARGGLGAVMGSKGLKAIVIDASGTTGPSLLYPEEFRQAKQILTNALLDHPQSMTYRDFGTAAMAQLCNRLGGLPTDGFSKGSTSQIEEISGEHMRELMLERGGESNPTHACMPGCVIRCSNIYGGKDGRPIVAPLEYETIGLLGTNLRIHDLDIVAQLNWEANDIGVDSIELGAALGVAAQAGILDLGDIDRVFELIDDVRKGTPLGRIIGNGATTTGNVFGVERVPSVKGQAMSAYDPRAIKGTGVTYATSPQGADHTAGLTIRAKVNQLDPKGQADLSRMAQINMAGYDTLGACIFAGFGFSTVPESIQQLLHAIYGWISEANILQQLGKQTLQMERKFNTLAGFTKAQDRLPDWMTKEALPPTESVFDVAEEDLDSVFNW